MKFYAGIGSRKTPQNIATWMISIAMNLEAMGYILRSGGADGADAAFEYGVQRWANQRIYLPWRGFNGYSNDDSYIVIGEDQGLTEIARLHHPAWNRLSPGGKALMTRNVAQVLGFWPESQKSDFVICWTPEGKGGGGTGQALRVAKTHNIRVFDLAIEADCDALQDCMDGRTAFPRA